MAAAGLQNFIVQILLEQPPKVYLLFIFCHSNSFVLLPILFKIIYIFT